MKIAIDGSVTNGRYRVECECGMVWNGTAEHNRLNQWSPALPVAECAVHLKLEHPNTLLDLRFTSRFTRWLESHWEHSNERQATGLLDSRREVLR